MCCAKTAFKTVLLIALVLRLWGIQYGLPHVYHQDEPIVVNHALAIGAEGWNTRTYMPPQFASYFLFIAYAAYFVLGKLLSKTRLARSMSGTSLVWLIFIAVALGSFGIFGFYVRELMG